MRQLRRRQLRWRQLCWWQLRWRGCEPSGSWGVTQRSLQTIWIQTAGVNWTAKNEDSKLETSWGWNIANFIQNLGTNYLSWQVAPKINHDNWCWNFRAGVLKGISAFALTLCLAQGASQGSLGAVNMQITITPQILDEWISWHDFQVDIQKPS